MKDLVGNALSRAGAALGGLLLVVALVACSGGEEQQELTPELHQELISRVTEYWQAVASRDYATAYEYTTPNYRSVFSKNMFLNNFGYSLDLELTGVEITHYDGDAAVASVAVRVMSTPTKPTSEASKALGALPNTRKEKWILRNGIWWKSPKI